MKIKISSAIRYLQIKYSSKAIEKALIDGLFRQLSINRVNNLKINQILMHEDKDVGKIQKWLNCKKIPYSLDLLLKYYELEVSAKEKKVNGSYYTPKYIIDYIVNNVITEEGTVCDPACGSGAFLMSAAEKLHNITQKKYQELFSKYVFGVDILSNSVEKTKIILSLLAIINGEDLKEYKFNLYQGDSLSIDWVFYFKKNKFDFVIGNPPYVRTKNLTSSIKIIIKKWATSNHGNTDLYIPFFELGISLLKDKGKLGYITPNTYLTSVNARILRDLLKSNRYVSKIIDFNGLQIFEGVSTYTCISILSKRQNPYFKAKIVYDLDKLNLSPFYTISYEKLTRSEWRLIPDNIELNIKRIENTGIPLYKYVKRFITGLATLNNKLFLVKDNGQLLITKEYKGKQYLIERKITKKIINPNRIKSYDKLLKNKERIIFPYNISDPKILIMKEKELKEKYPYTYNYFLAIKKELLQRDKGNKQYEAWYAFGRRQGLDCHGKKIIMPMINNRATFLTVKNEDALIYSGYAIFPKSDEEFSILDRILNSNVFWYYIKNTSKNYSGGFKSFAKNYVKNFSIPSFTEEEKKYIVSYEPIVLQKFLLAKYNLIGFEL